MKYIKYFSIALLVLSAGFSSYADEKRKGNSAILHVPNYGKSTVKPVKGGDAPDFSAMDSSGKKVTLSSLKGKKNVLLVFYPGDNTPGCTKQLCAIRDDYKDLEKLDLAIYGINQADSESHNKFIKDYKFPFPLIIDKDKKISESYDCLGFLGIINRTVVIINKEGKIVLYERGMPELKPKFVSNLLK